MINFPVLMQRQALSRGKVLGRVRIGAEAADAGRAHWRDVCNLQVEQARWHTVQLEPPIELRQSGPDELCELSGHP